MVMDITKECIQCEQTKSISEFHKTRCYVNSGKIYYSSYCKQCHTQRTVIYKRNKRLINKQIK